jgi:hypothetical protein
MAPLYSKPSVSMMETILFFSRTYFRQLIFYVGIPATVFGSAGITGVLKHSRESMYILIDDRYGYENFKKLSSDKQQRIMHECSQEALIARNNTELHLP